MKGSAATAWIPLEAEARVLLSGLHGVPNDDRLPHAAADEIRAWIFGRLMQLADRQAKGQTLTPVEKGALDAFADAVVARRVNAAQQALNEYYRWAVSLGGRTTIRSSPGQGTAVIASIPDAAARPQ